MKRSGCFAVAVIALISIGLIALFAALELLKFQTKELGRQLGTELVQVDALPPGSTRTIGEGHITMAAFSPDGRTLVTATTRGLVFYDTNGYQPRLSVPVVFGVDELAWSPGGLALAVTGNDVGLALFDSSTGQQTLEFEGSSGRSLHNLDWSPDSRYLAATVLGTYRKDVWIWDAQTGQRLFALPDGSGVFGLSFADGISWSPEGNQLVVAFSYSGLGEPPGGHEEIQVWEIGDEPKLASKWLIDTNGVMQLAWAANGHYLVLRETTSLRVLDSQSGATLATAHDLFSLNRFALSPDGAALVATTDSSGVLSRFSVPDLQLVSQSETPLLGVGSVDWSLDGTSIVVSEEYSDRFQVWSALDKRLLADVSTGSPQAVQVGWSPDSRLLAVASSNRTVYIYDGEIGDRIQAIGNRERGAAEMAWSFDGRLLAISSYEQTTEGRDYATEIWTPEGSLKATIPGALIAWANLANMVLIAPDGQEGCPSCVQVWAIEADGQPAKQSEFEKVGMRFTVSPDDRYVAGVEQWWEPSPAAAIHSKIVVWELKNQHPVVELYGVEMRYVRSLAWSPDGAWLAASYDYNCPRQCARLEIWNTATWESYKTFGPGQGSCWSLSWSPDSRWIVATDSPTGTAITLYPLDDQQPIRELDHHLGLYAVAAWSPDGQKIASTNYDGQLIIWDAAALLPAPATTPENP